MRKFYYLSLFTEEQLDFEGHKCDHCGEVIAFKRDFIRHLRSKHNLRPFECQCCAKTFTSILALQDHENIHGVESIFQCTICGENFGKLASLKLHQKTHSEVADFSCDVCHKTFSNMTQLRKHSSLHHGTDAGGSGSVSHSCEVCGKVFGSRESHAIHIKTHKKERPHVCDICNTGFFSSGGLNRHRKVHKRNEGLDSSLELRCSHCHANFSYEESLRKHLSLVHNIGPREMKEEPSSLPLSEDRVVEELQEQLNEGYAPKNSELYDVPGVSETLESKYPVDPFRCGICEESFTDVDMMCDHFTNCHTGDQKLYCDTCCVGCSNEHQMERHKLVHVAEEKHSIIKKQSDDLPHICQVCGKGYKSLQELSKHGRVHNIDKHYKCTICTASFPIKSALDKHLLVHTGERPFKCDVCLKSFRQSAALVRHKLWTHRLKNQNKCEICGKTFFTAALLIYHLDVHGEQGRQLKAKLKEAVRLEEYDTGDKDGDARDAEEVNGNVVNDRDKNIENKCEYCSKCFPSYVALLTHKLSHKLSASYKCDQCHRTFREKRYLQKHKMTHRGVRSWKCDICKKGFAAKLTLIRHSQVHLREALRPTLEDNLDGTTNTVCTLPSILRCNECNFNFSHKSHYVRHKLLHSGTPLLKCGLCDKMFVHKSDIIRHKVMHSFMFTCDICNRNFHKRSLYIMHKRKHIDEKPFKCKECHKSFSSSSNYNAHRRIHSGDKPFKCDRCHYRCSQSGRLVKHKQMHTGIKPFLCQTCGKFFANAESIKVHQRLHTGDRPFKCDNCSKSFINGGSLSQHKRDHIKEEMFKCTLCHHKFRRESHLEKHKMYHVQQHFSDNPRSAVMYYMCDICGRVFDKKKYLYTHRNVHTRQKNYACSICNKQLASRLALKNHEHIHAGLMPYKCKFCDKEFRSSSNLKRHVRIHDGQELLHCEECKETFLTKEDLDQHSHVHLMMVNASTNVDSCPGTDNQTHLYVFESMHETIDSNQPIIVNNSQQIFVDGTQNLLVFPERSEGHFPEIHRDGSHHQTVTEEHLSPHHHHRQLANDELTNQVEEVSSHQQHHQVAGVGGSSNLHHDEMEVGHHHQETMVSSIDETHDSHSSQSAKIINLITSSHVQELDAPQEDMDHDQIEQDPSTFIQTKQDLEIEQPQQQRSLESTNTVTKSHQCTVCYKTFAKKQYLTKHMYRHREVKPHECDICHKRFAQKFEVVVHKIKHTGEKPYSCDICKKLFRSKVNLTNHKMRHNGEFPFLCSICRKGFSTQLQLERHVTLHTGMLPFNCNICNKGYSIKLNLIKHLAKTHNQTLSSNESEDVVDISPHHDPLQQDMPLQVMTNHHHHHHGNTELSHEDLHHKPETIQSDAADGGHISIKKEMVLIEDFNSNQSLTLFHKPSSEQEDIPVASNVSLSIANRGSNTQHGVYCADQHPQSHTIQYHHQHNERQGQSHEQIPEQMYQLRTSSINDTTKTIDIGDQAEVYTTSYVQTLPTTHAVAITTPQQKQAYQNRQGIKEKSCNDDTASTSTTSYHLDQSNRQHLFLSGDQYQYQDQHQQQQQDQQSKQQQQNEEETVDNNNDERNAIQLQQQQEEEQRQQQSSSTTSVTVLEDPSGFFKHCISAISAGNILSSEVDPKLLQAILQQQQQQVSKTGTANSGDIGRNLSPVIVGGGGTERIIVAQGGGGGGKTVMGGTLEGGGAIIVSSANTDEEGDIMAEEHMVVDGGDVEEGGRRIVVRGSRYDHHNDEIDGESSDNDEAMDQS